MVYETPADIEDTSWIAVRGATPEAFFGELGLSDARPATWSQGLEVIGGYHANCPSELGELSGVFVSPLLRGWRLAIGHYVGAGPLVRSDGDHRTGWRRVANWCKKLSLDFSEAHAFTDQAQLDWYSWISARDGEIVRQVVFEDGEFLSEKGRPTQIESRLISQFRPDEVRDYWTPDVGVVPSIAEAWSIDRSSVITETQSDEHGFVAVTPWGRKHRVVFSDLG